MEQHTLESAVKLQKSGELVEAEKICRELLAVDPKNAAAMGVLAGIARRTDRNGLAVELLQTAVKLEPNSAPLQFNLGNALRDQGKSKDAIAAYRNSISLEPGLAQAHTNLANSLKEAGKVDEAILSYRIAVSLRPDHAQSHNNLGVALTIGGDPEEAISACRRAVELKPDFPEGLANLGNALAKVGRNAEAKQAYLQSLKVRPDYALVFLDLGKLFCQMRDLDAALEAANRAVSLLPSSSKAYSLLGQVLAEKNQPQAAISAFEKAIELNPDASEVHVNLGAVLKTQGALDSSIEASNRAIGLNPEIAEVYCNLASALKDMGQIDDAVKACRKAIELKPDDAAMHSSLVGILHYHPHYTARGIADELENWNERHALPLAGEIPIHGNDRSADRVLRIGYVSPDFRSHVVGRNLLPLFRNHDHEKFHVTCYAQVRNADAMTAEYQQLSDSWRNIVGLTDSEVAKQIRDDRIDILVDLALHTADNRLLVFARKPAPIQMTFAGYPGSTGLTAIDYRISDPYLDPPEIDPDIYSEQTVRLPDSFWCFDPLENFDITVKPAPAITNGYITFGCLNNFGKTNDLLFALWARVLQRVEGSRMLLLAPVGSPRQLAVEQFASHGILADRIGFVAGGSVREYLELYHRLDICLDTFPYNGHSTSLDALWMGVPVVTLMGETVVSRAGWSQLSNVGLRELVAWTPEQFVETAAALAGNLEGIQTMRAGLRLKMGNSLLMDSIRFASNVEDVFHQAWKFWCGKNQTSAVG